jgi:PAS domain S-box-containing protein
MFRVLSDFALKLLEIPTEKELVWYVAREVVGRMGFDDCVIYQVDTKKKLLRQVAAIGAKNPQDDHIVNALEIPLGEGITGQVAQSGEPLLIGDLRGDDRYIPDVEPALSEICVPLVIDGEVVGVIDCEDSRANHFNDRHLETLNTIAAMTSAKLKLIDEAYRVAARTEELYSLNSQLREEVEERQKAEAAVGQRDAWLRAILENAPIEIVLKDRQGRIMVASRNIAKVLGITPEETVGCTSADFFPAEVAQIYMTADRRVVETGEPIQQEVTETWGGATRHYLNAKFPLRAEGGEIVGICSLTNDITGLKEAEERLRQAQKMEAVGQLTGGIAHDFNNLLAVIVGNAELLADRIGANDAEVAAVLRAAGRGAELTQRLLAFSRRQPLDPRKVNLDRLVVGMHQLLHRTLGESIEIEIVPGPPLWNIVADPGQLENALLNLAINARDAMLGGGRLVVRTANARLEEGDLASHMEIAPGDYVSLSVGDTGAGMTPEVLGHAFEPFFTTKDVGMGSGLGLSMVYGFARQSGGDVSIESKPGEGCTVTIYLPRAEEAAEQSASDQRVSAPRGRGETVLVIEDDTDLRELAQAMLERLGYRVLAAGNAVAGLELLESETAVDLMLVDVQLPGGVSGLDLAEQVMARSPGTRILFMSGYARPQGRAVRALPKGAEMLPKPFYRMDLAQRVRAVLDS